ncbi:hypothetical protein MTO96_007384 [Rhipicephalus appendiculatus]
MYGYDDFLHRGRETPVVWPSALPFRVSEWHAGLFGDACPGGHTGWRRCSMPVTFTCSRTRRQAGPVETEDDHETTETLATPRALPRF